MNNTNNKLTPNVITVDIDKLSSMLSCGLPDVLTWQGPV